MEAFLAIVALFFALGVGFNILLYNWDPAGLKNDPRHCQANPSHIYCR